MDQGLEQGKEIFALPGRVMDPNSKGCNNLIKLGAHMVTETADILEILNINNHQSYDVDFCKKKELNKNKIDFTRKADAAKNLLAPIEKIVYSVLSVEPKFIDDIISETQIAPQEVCMILNKMSVGGFIIEPVRNYFSIKL